MTPDHKALVEALGVDALALDVIDVENDVQGLRGSARLEREAIAAIESLSEQLERAEAERTAAQYDAIADAVTIVANAASEAFMKAGIKPGEWDGDDIVKDVSRGITNDIERLATERTAAVAEAIERCAKVCDEWATKHLIHNERDYPYTPVEGYFNPAQAATVIAQCIRALSPDAGGKLPQSAPSSAGAGPTVCCHDCRREYGHEHGFPDFVIPTYIWRRISPSGDEGGLLCPSCICKRLHDAGISGVDGAFMSGPIQSVSRPTMQALRMAENIQERLDAAPPATQTAGMADAITREQIDEVCRGADATWARNLTDRCEYERRAALIVKLRDTALAAGKEG